MGAARGLASEQLTQTSCVVGNDDGEAQCSLGFHAVEGSGNETKLASTNII